MAYRAQVPDDVKDRVKDPGVHEAHASSLIEVGKSIFGHPYGTTEEKFMELEGKPDGYLSLSEGQTVLIYGKNTGFIFENSKLMGVRLTTAIIDWEFGKKLKRKCRFDDIKWHTSKGLRENMSEKDTRKIFGDQLVNADYDHFVKIGKDILEIDFHTRMMEGKEAGKFVGGIFLTRE